MCRAPRSRRKGAVRVGTRTMRVRRVRYFFRTRVSCTDRAREKVVQHGSWHGPCPLFRVARVFSTGRVREACALIFRVARGVLSSTRGMFFGQHGSRLALHGACQAVLRSAWGVFLQFARGVQIGTGHSRFSTGQAWFLHGSCNFPSSEVGNLIFSQYSGFIMI